MITCDRTHASFLEAPRTLDLLCLFLETKVPSLFATEGYSTIQRNVLVTIDKAIVIILNTGQRSSLG